MSIRFPHELAAAAEYAERVVDGISSGREAQMADAVIALPVPGDIRMSVGPGFIPAAGPRKHIPGQTYH